ncbi:MAG: hypothetical protein KF752_16945 [Pirellulaceae bacterium]|nr:hypothetical protein [Pirellulaceae bacterium]
MSGGELIWVTVISRLIAQWTASQALLGWTDIQIGQLAFASVFGVLAAWLWWMPNSWLVGERQSGDLSDAASSPASIAVARYTAIIIAIMLMLLYLLWS